MHVQVKDALAGAGAAVHRDPTIAAAVGVSDLHGDAMEMADERVVLVGEIGERRDVLARNDQYVRRARGVDVAKRDRAIVLVYAICSCLTGCDSTEEAIAHGAALTGLTGGRKTRSSESSMDFSLTPEQSLLQRTAREALAVIAPMTHVRAMLNDPRGTTDAVWKELVALGWPGIPFDEADGGVGLGLAELAIVLAEMGRVALPGPFLSTVVAGRVIAHAADSTQRRRWLPSIADGSRVATLAFLEASGRWSFDDVTAVARPQTGGFSLAGTKTFVPDAHGADLVVCAVRRADDGEPVLAVIEPSPERVRAQPTVDGTRKVFRLDLDGLRVAEDAMLSGDAVVAIAAALDEARVALAADMTGGAERVLEMTVEHVKTRRQFDQPIGAFQAVQHACADMMVAVECAKAATTYAAWAIDQRADDAAIAAATAKATAGETYRHVTAKAIQLHGGIGFTWEHDLHLFYKRAMSDDVTYGDATWNRELVAERLGL